MRRRMRRASGAGPHISSRSSRRSAARASLGWSGALWVLLALAGCYGGDPESLDGEQAQLASASAEQPDQAADADAGPNAPTDPQQEQAEFVADVVRELDALYGDAAAPSQRAQGERGAADPGAEINPEAIEFARLLAQQLEAAAPSDAGRAPASQADDAGATSSQHPALLQQ